MLAKCLNVKACGATTVLKDKRKTEGKLKTFCQAAGQTMAEVLKVTAKRLVARESYLRQKNWCIPLNFLFL
jgi:hypothetical protein